jgi:hypothetical protein
MRYLVYDNLSHPGHPIVVPEDHFVIAIMKKVGGPFDTREQAEEFVRAYLAELASETPKG